MTDEEILTSHGLRLTAVRLLIWRTVKDLRHTFGTNDILATLPHMDASSIFRTLHRFEQAGLIHSVDDGAECGHYCICPASDHAEGHYQHHHYHFHCTQCGQTYCLIDVPAPQVPQIAGYQITDAEFVLKGLCPHCRPTHEA